MGSSTVVSMPPLCWRPLHVVVHSELSKLLIWLEDDPWVVDMEILYQNLQVHCGSSPST